MKINVLLFSLLLFLLNESSIAQYQSVSATVKDSKTNEVLIGVSIQLKGTSVGSITDSNGKFVLANKVLTDNDILVFSYVGYQTRELLPSSVGSVVYLEPQVLLFDEVIVTALGIKRNSNELGYSIQRIDAKAVNEVASPNFTDNLAGKFAGVTVSQGATGVGSTSKITIRGEASFANNNPLFVIDGIPINNNSIINFTNDAAAGFQEVDFGNGAMDINADEVESVSVLKGPAAAALYGTRAANGVIIIITKNGANAQFSKRFGVEFSSSTAVEQAFKLPEFQNTYGQGNSGQFAFADGLGGGVNDNISYSWGPKLNDSYLTPQFDSPVTLPDGSVVRGGDVAVHGGAIITPTEMRAYPNNLRDFYQIGITTNQHLAFESGFEKGYYRLSLSDKKSESIIPGVNLDQKQVAARLLFKPIQNFEMSATGNYSFTSSDNRPANGYGSENVNYALVAWGPRSLNIKALKDYWQPGLENTQHYSFNYTFFDNPYFTLLENRNSFNRNRVYGGLRANYQINAQFSIQLRTGMDYSSEEREFRRAFSSNRFINGGYANHSVVFWENNSDVLLNYSVSRNSLIWDLSLGAHRMNQQYSTLQLQTLRLAQPGIFNLSNTASPIETFERKAKKQINSIYGFSKWKYENWLFLEVTARNDWSSALATTYSASNTSFFYPSISGSLILSNKIDLPDFVSFAKIRANWAQVGNDTEPYQTSGVFFAQIPVNGQPTFSGQNTIPNTNLNPEQTTSFEFGADIRFFQNRIRFDVAYFHSLTENQIISLPVAISSGYTQRVINGGAVRSKGYEVVAVFTPVQKNDLKWDISLNFSRTIAIVESLPDEIERLTLAYSRIYDNVNQTVWFQVNEGGRIGDMYGTGYKRNENGDFIVDANGLYITDNTLQKIGNYNPDFILVTSNEIAYKNFKLSFLLDWRYGGKLVSRTRALATVAGQLKETENRPEDGIVAEGVVNVGTAENPIWQPNTKAVSAETYFRMKYDRNHEENNTYNATYVKLRELRLGYTIKDAKFLKENQQITLSLFGRNLWAWSEIPHFDPEQLAVQGNQFVSGVEDMSYATSRSIGFSAKFEF